MNSSMNQGAVPLVCRDKNFSHYPVNVRWG